MKAFILYNYYSNLTTKRHQSLYAGLVRVALVIHLGELLALLMLTYVSSSEYYGTYRLFILFQSRL